MSELDAKRQRDAWRIFEDFLLENRDSLVHIAMIGDGECGAMLERMKDALCYRCEPFQPRYRKVRIPSRLRRDVFERDAYRCCKCGGWIDLCCDHIYPESKGGETALNNLQTLCRGCNSRKADRAPGV